jgi:hypothetical protein
MKPTYDGARLRNSNANNVPQKHESIDQRSAGRAMVSRAVERER